MTHPDPISPPQPPILTNMAFWQSRTWTDAARSIYPLDGHRDPDAMPAWREAWRLYRQRRREEVVVTMGARTSLLYGLLCLVTGRPSRQVMTEVFLDEPRPRSLAYRVKTAAMRRVAARAFGIITNSSAERLTNAERLQIAPERLIFVPLPATDAFRDDPETGDDGYVLAAGRSGRDYPTLLQALKGLPVKTILVCGHDDLRGHPVPDTVTVHRDLARNAYLALLRKARIVALPLHEAVRSTGQVVLLEAMALGKPVAVSDVSGIRDYIRDGETAMAIPVGDAHAWRNALTTLLNNAALRETLGRNALAWVTQNAAVEPHAEAKLHAIARLARDT